ncbi:type II toxin-antitoxin system PemK/MazF family toxin [Halococcus salifodinae]|uniref:Transcriptional modulator of MazE/toxin MazF n=1 Tax=Halococcus salifodinae DSM 8989 TaxID=1227456 RepID=M0N4T8_9EURY|nr:type II toxin-antitoxin system PemK/MazF family toxin [Halococcus salifodinae]EMA51710.1 transcriptional modulator of MazE/toxin MazF [Halococcus salifodinae DSM 8989]
MSDDVPAVRRGDIVIVELDPTRGHEIRKTRPSVVVQNDVGNRNSHTTVVAPATTTHRGYPFEVLVNADESDFNEDSSVRLDQLRTVDISERIEFVAGRLPASVMREIDSALQLELDLD